MQAVEVSIHKDLPTIYTNAVSVQHSETEFLLSAMFMSPEITKTPVLSRWISSPLHTKRLLAALQENVASYEKRFGPIREMKPPDDPNSKSLN